MPDDGPVDEALTARLAQMAGAMGILEALDPIIQAVAGYRRRLEAEGFSPTAAEEMAVALHGVLWAQHLAGLR